MQTAETTAPATVLKIRELCQTILERPDFAELRRKIEAFMNDESVKFQYQMLNERGTLLQQKQSQGMPVTDEEIGQFEALRQGFFGNAVATEFLEAQQEVGKLQDLVMQHLNKTFELGRVPAPEDFDTCCDSGCGCH